MCARAAQLQIENGEQEFWSIDVIVIASMVGLAIYKSTFCQMPLSTATVSYLKTMSKSIVLTRNKCDEILWNMNESRKVCYRICLFIYLLCDEMKHRRILSADEQWETLITVERDDENVVPLPRPSRHIEGAETEEATAAEFSGTYDTA